MGRGILQTQLSRFEEIGKRAEEKAAWKRREGFNLTYEFVDAIKGGGRKLLHFIRRSLYGLIPRGLPRLKVRVYWKDERDHPKRT